ncbi:MAG TPA: FKBP-type peptidyl-prolyl cis-trans isomerase [Actinophytocola sp.]|uniref:FKBP-type peptidyl-prolyl cis-trans isomerase n=1 Tax=Actinophytocola sp. TaxID=1872138 RepID=UPI002DDC9D05|nr:FKBP-type peptidyl-prolyl cis-trans isomerase [Actinophytocola sp.]HEV2778454.1 FKBP-type peptidyl-prolyl cis-trans isomerase [Actinophytocola sp.]
MSSRAAATVLLCCTLLATACAAEPEDLPGNAVPLTGSRTLSPAPPKAPACTVEDVVVEGSRTDKPRVTVPEQCAPPTTLQVKDVIPGTGREVTSTSGLSLIYLLFTWSDGKEINVLDRQSGGDDGGIGIQKLEDSPFPDGWEEGLIGARQGARRLVIVPPDKGYGPQAELMPLTRGDPVWIKPNETLVYVIDLKEVYAVFPSG